MYLPQSHKSVYRWSTLQFCQEGAGTLSSASALYYERVLISCLQQLDALEANDYTNNEDTSSFYKSDSTQHSEWHHVTVSME